MTRHSRSAPSSRSSSQVDRAPEPAESSLREPDSIVRWLSVPVAYWTLAVVLLVTTPRMHPDRVRVLDGRWPTLLQSENAWKLPVIESPLARFGDCPIWLFAVVGALPFTVAALRWQSSFISPLSALMVVVLASTMPAELLLPAILLASLAAPKQSWPRSLRLAWIGAIVAGAVFVTREAGLVALAAACVLSTKGGPRTLRASLAVAVALMALAAVLVWQPGLRDLLLRPISWVWIHPPEALLPSLQPVLTSIPSWEEVGLLGVAALVAVQEARSPALTLPRAACVASLLAIGLGASHYLWLCVFALSICSTPPEEARWPVLMRRGIATVSLVTAAILLAPRGGPLLDTLLGIESLPRLVDPTVWNVRGRVLLRDLDQSIDWQSPKIQQRFPLIADDRWESHGQIYPEYAAVIRDLREVRDDAYLRSDFEWGGYKVPVDDWNPTLLVLPSSALDDLRRVSMSPHWRLMGIDSRRTIFGLTGIPANRPAALRAFETLQQWEWPSESAAPPSAHVIAADEAGDFREVAAAICAMRFPYAALRVLPDDDDARTHDVQAWCYLELAHRVRRHTGRTSLLDQYRGVVGMKRAIAANRWTASQRLRAARSLETLGLTDLATAVAVTVTDAGPLDDVDRTERDQAADLIRQCDAAPPLPPPLTDEERLRLAFARGEPAAVQLWLANLDDESERYYAALLAVVQSGGNTSSASLVDHMEGRPAPSEHRAEAWFYEGCLRIEAGQIAPAITAFEESQRLGPDSPLGPLREFYLQQLQR